MESRVFIFLPGAKVYFWVPSGMKGRSRPDPTAWRGPATVIMKDGDKQVFLSWRGRLLLVSVEQLRAASREEQDASTIALLRTLIWLGILQEVDQATKT